MKPIQTITTIVIFALAMVTVVAAQDKPPEKKKRKDEAGVVSLDVQSEGNRVHLLVGRKLAEQTARLEYVRSEDGGETWTSPSPLGEGQPAPDPVHRGMDAQIAAHGEQVVAVWTTRADTRMGRGPLASSISSDGGKTWKAGPSPSDSDEIIDHAFVDIAVDAKGTFHCVWLDGRAGIEGKGLRYARSTDGGVTWTKNVTLDQQTCECCWNKIAISGESVYVLYRDKEPRDMAMIVSKDGGLTWGEPVTVGKFDWRINGCPHVGGGIAIDDRNGKASIHAVVWTAKGQPQRGAFVLNSPDGGATWTQPAQLGNPESWRPDIAIKDGIVTAVWDAYVEGGSAVFSATSKDGGAWSAPVQLSAKGSSAAVPRIIPVSGGLRIFWTERETGKPTVWINRMEAKK